MLLQRLTPGNNSRSASLLPVAFAVVVLLGAVPTARGGEEPVPLPDTGLKVTIQTASIPPAIHNSLPGDESSYASKKPHRVGLTHMVLDVTRELDTNRVTADDGEVHYWVSTVDVTFAYRSIDIYIASKYAPGSCQYQTVLDHEREHVRADAQVVETYAERVKAIEFTLHLPTLANPWLGKAARDGRKHAKTKLEELLAPLLAEMERERREASEALDPADHRAFIQNACS